MKTTKSYFKVIITILVVSAMAACSKEDATNDLSSGTIQTVNEIASTEMIEEEIFSTVDDAISYSESKGLKSASTTPQCATISVKPLVGGYPKTITIDFGSNCVGTRGISRSGVISFTISDSLRTPGALLNVSFNALTVNGYSVNGTMSFKNTSTSSTPSFYQETDLTMKKSDGTVITKTKTANREWIEGAGSGDISDDVFRITSNADVSSSTRGSYSYTVTEPLIIAASCDMMREGIIKYTTSESPEPVIIDFGDGECDLKVLISERNVEGKEINLTK